MSDIVISCAPHLPAVTSWVDNHPLLKIIIPSLITGTVAASIGSLAYRVAYNQREIAANKYKLDLFDKRFPIYEEFKENFSGLSKPSRNIEVFNNYSLAKKGILLKCSRIFSGFEHDFHIIQTKPKEIVSNDIEYKKLISREYDIYFSIPSKDIDSEIKEQLEHISTFENDSKYTPEREYHHHYIRDATQRLEFLEDVKKKWDEYKEEYHQRSKRKKELSDKMQKDKLIVDEAFKKISENIEEQLTLSHNPYEKDKEIYIFSFIFNFIRFIKRFTFKKPSD
ncbi:hypothetical protein KBX73_14885 [Acetobacter persici]|uniref:hypothetical protein n=1 Tax=Acetobacter persici TaxID=1076596 RepID=UPI001BA66521|nr:hypothetical protein [Acetobacter persici]MBS1016881.1 hypothetical protein [Acetobacter persici]MCP9321029.1 hypothetical protein [Acetobacter persici]